MWNGNKRLALGALVAFYGINGRRLILTNDAACEDHAGGRRELDSVDEIAAILENDRLPAVRQAPSEDRSESNCL